MAKDCQNGQCQSGQCPSKESQEAKKSTENAEISKVVNPFGEIKRVVAVMSGKGGVGKSSVAAMLATSAQKEGKRVGILDADITGPSIPKLFGIKERAGIMEKALMPVKTANGIKVISINLLLENEDEPVIWRGPIISNVVKQFYEEVNWGDLDYLFVDLPPGTGDVPLTVMQSLPLNGIVIVTSPQDLVSMIVKKAIRMAGYIGVKVFGFVENMAYIECPDCGKKIEAFGESHAEDVAKQTGIAMLGRLPLVPEIAKLSDEGKIELVNQLYPEFFEGIATEFLKKIDS